VEDGENWRLFREGFGLGFGANCEVRLVVESGY